MNVLFTSAHEWPEGNGSTGKWMKSRKLQISTRQHVLRGTSGGASTTTQPQRGLTNLPAKKKYTEGAGGPGGGVTFVIVPASLLKKETDPSLVTLRNSEQFDVVSHWETNERL